MENIRIKKVKSLIDTDLISLSPITLLVGENGSGKSTFLRTFPLVKQSIRKHTDGPVLWVGDVDDYVDFGSFLETITNGQIDEAMEFQFNFNLNLKRIHYYSNVLNEKLENKDNYNVVYNITINHIGNKEYISRLLVHFCQTDFIFEMNPNPREVSISVNEITIPMPKKFYNKKNKINRIAWDKDYNSIFGFQLPPVDIFLDFISKSLSSSDNINLGIALEDFGIEDILLPFSISEMAMQIVGECLCKDIPLDNFSDDRKLQNDKKYDSEVLGYIDQLIDNINNLADHEKEVNIAILKLIYFYGCFSIMDKYLDTYFRQVHYIAPLRATAERYYRLRNLSIEEVDYQGKNLSIFLDGLKRSNQLEEFNQWTDELLGFHVSTKNDGGHLSIQVALKGKEKSTNLSDTGFGFSQILPIITQLWKISTKKPHAINPKKSSLNPPFVLAIEQPELHLHPALQANLVDAFINSIKLAQNNGYKLQLILETHSETIVNYLGLAVAENKINNKDISIVIFDKNTDNITKVNKSEYDEQGYLCDWPIGFFSPRR